MDARKQQMGKQWILQENCILVGLSYTKKGYHKY